MAASLKLEDTRILMEMEQVVQFLWKHKLWFKEHIPQLVLLKAMTIVIMIITTIL